MLAEEKPPRVWWGFVLYKLKIL